MIIKGKDVRLEFVIAPGVGPIPTSFDVAITGPENVGKYNYYDGGAGLNVAYMPPIPSSNPAIEDVMGSFAFTKRFDEVGLWKIELDTGISGTHSIVHTEMVFVVDHDIIINPTIFLP